VDATTQHTIMATTPALIFELADAATTVKLNWGPTELHTLLGDHVFTMKVTMLNFPLMDYFTFQTRTINLKVTSACETTEIFAPQPALQGLIEYWNGPSIKSKDYLVREFDWMTDSYSKVVSEDHSRPWPANAFFCGERVYTFEVKKYSRTVAYLKLLPGYYTGKFHKNGVEIVDGS